MPYNKEQRKQYNKNYRKLRPKSATTPEYYQFYKFIDTLTNEELMVLVTKRKRDYKHATTDEEKIRLKTEMKIITDLYSLRKEATFIYDE